MIADFDWNTAGTWCGAFATFSAALVALFMNKWWACYDRPQFRVETGNEDHKFQYSHTNQAGRLYTIRLDVFNEGRGQASEVECLLSEFYKLEGDIPSKVAGFMPIRLKWTHVDKPVLSTLAPDSFRLLDFGFLFIASGSSPDELQLILEVFPANTFWKLRSGRFRVGLIFSCREGVLHKCWLDLSFKSKEQIAREVFSGAESPLIEGAFEIRVSSVA